MAITRTILKKRIYEVISDMTSHRYRDQSWEGVSEVFGRIRAVLNAYRPDLSLDVRVENGGYRENGGGKWKEYLLSIQDEEGKEVIGGNLNAHAAGTVEDPFKAYDMTVVLWF